MKVFRSIHSHQQGAALPVALVMLLISTMLGLASIRSATIQEKTSANIYDRSLAYQSAEAALLHATGIINNTTQNSDEHCSAKLTNVIIQDCSETSSENVCPSIPGGTFTPANNSWATMNLEDSSDNSKRYPNPAYYIEHIGFTNSNGLDAQDTSTSNYGEKKSQLSFVVYRVTARSSQPSEKSSRSIVALQTTISRACKFPVVKEKNNG